MEAISAKNMDGVGKVRAAAAVPAAVEKFAVHDLSNLRDELMQSGLDSWQAAELIGAFLSTRGYGVSSDAVRQAAVRIDAVGCSLARMQEELEKLAFVM